MKTDDQRTLAAQQLQELRTLAETTTELAARFQGQAVNNVLEIGTVILPPAGQNGHSWQAAAGSIEVDNQGTHPMTVVAASPAATAPTSGTGMYPVPANSRRVINVASREVTVYGTAGDVYGYQAFTAGARPVVI